MLNLQICSAGVALMLAAFPASAQQPIVVDGAVPTASVSYADLNLASPSGRQALERRVAQAAGKLCTESARKSLEREIWERGCLTAAMARAGVDMSRAAADAATRTASRSTIVVAAR